MKHQMRLQLTTLKLLELKWSALQDTIWMHLKPIDLVKRPYHKATSN